MPVGAIVSLICFGIGALAVGIFIVLRGGKIKMPKGRHFFIDRGSLKLHLILGEGCACVWDEKKFADYCAQIHEIVRVEFAGDFYDKEIFKKCHEIIVHFMVDAEFNQSLGKKLVSYAQKAAALCCLTGRWIWGDSVPTMRIRANYINMVKEIGEPLIHELCHAYLDDYKADSTDHADQRVWRGVGGATSIQAIADAKVRDSLSSARKELDNSV